MAGELPGDKYGEHFFDIYEAEQRRLGFVRDALGEETADALLDRQRDALEKLFDMSTMDEVQRDLLQLMVDNKTLPPDEHTIAVDALVKYAATQLTELQGIEGDAGGDSVEFKVFVMGQRYAEADAETAAEHRKLQAYHRDEYLRLKDLNPDDPAWRWHRSQMFDHITAAAPTERKLRGIGWNTPREDEAA